MKKLTLLAGALVFSLTSLNGCAVTPPPVQTSTQPKKLAVQPIHNPPQVIYRIDKNRYLTLEDYSNCDDGSIYYHNDNKKIKTKLWFLSRGTMNYKGKFIWAAKNDDMLAIPFVRGDNDACGDSLRGCAYSILSASNDGGKKFSDITFDASNSSGSKEYTIVLTDDAIYIKSDRYPADKYSINSAGEFYNVRQAWIRDEFYKGMIKLGVPEDVLVKKNPLGYSDLRLTNKYHYSEAQSAALIVKAAALFDKYNDSPITEKLPDLKQDSSASNRFSCKTTLHPSQPKNQG
ncbi:T6SS immunity protein Tli3 family protein [Rahnella sp. PD4]|uniref:T6SS immunity protein Tli3 family protein n=1 Tax=Rahnella sp. PD4 TaxID=3368611 RepID=UPI003BA033EE